MKSSPSTLGKDIVEKNAFVIPTATFSPNGNRAFDAVFPLADVGLNK